jgi:hypothetical protein
VVTTAEIVIDNDVTLDGGGQLTLDGNGAHRVLSVPEGVAAEVIGFTVTGGSTGEGGGGIQNLGTLTLADSVVSGNTARFGGGIRNEGQAQVIDTTVSNNFATQAAGGVANRPGATMTLTRSTVQANISAGTDGGIRNTTGALTVNDTTVSGNEAGGEAGGIRNSGSGTMAVTNSTVSGNTGTYGGGIYNQDAGILTVTNSTVSGNTSTNGGGGGVANEATMTLVSTTLASNSGTEIGTAISNVGTATVRNTLIAGDCWLATPLDSLGGNIESEGNTCGLGHPSDQVSVPAPLLLLGPLADNGGPTQTHALLPGSVAIDVIPADMCEVTEDQRGLPRPVGTTDPKRCDVGAFEVEQ